MQFEEKKGGATDINNKNNDDYDKAVEDSVLTYTSEEINNNDLKNGLCVYWFSNGQKKEEVNFKEGKKNGLLSGWYQNGNKRCEINYINDDKDGLSIYWYQNGNKKGEENWESGLPVGLWTEWHNNGKIYSEGVFRSGILISKLCWDVSGSKIECSY